MTLANAHYSQFQRVRERDREKGGDSVVTGSPKLKAWLRAEYFFFLGLGNLFKSDILELGSYNNLAQHEEYLFCS